MRDPLGDLWRRRFARSHRHKRQTSLHQSTDMGARRRHGAGEHEQGRGSRLGAIPDQILGQGRCRRNGVSAAEGAAPGVDERGVPRGIPVRRDQRGTAFAKLDVGGNYHGLDYPLFGMDIRENAIARAAAYLNQQANSRRSEPSFGQNRLQLVRIGAELPGVESARAGR